jgi:hypothetical protein
MRIKQWMMIATLVAGVPALASAQGGAAGTTGTTETTTTQTTTTTTTTSDTADTTTARDVTSQDDDTAYDDVSSHWTASGFVGSAFGDQVDGSHLDFGGSLGYLWRGAIGPEFLAGFSPNFDLANNILTEQPQINSYMVNLMAAAPLGEDGQWQPFISGGLGSITLNADTLANPGDLGDNAIEEQLDPDASQFGGNIGFGVMGYSGPVGVRADVRYFRGFDRDNLDEGESAPGQAILSGLDFWRANVGLAFRW